MAKYQWTGAGETVGQPPSQFVNEWAGVVSNWQVVADEEAVAGGVSLATVAGTGRRFLRLTAAPQNFDPATDRLDSRFRFYTDPSTGSLHIPRFFAKLINNDENAVYSDFFTSAQIVRISQYATGAYKDIQALRGSIEYPAGLAWYQGRVLWEPTATGLRMKVKVWSDAEDEPEPWNIEGDPNVEPVIGDIGVGVFTTASNRLDWITFGTGGDDADIITAEEPPPPDGIPSITLLGEPEYTLIVGDTWVDPLAEASDPEDGNLTDAIQVTGTVNTGAAGAYPLDYDVQDSDLNWAPTKTRMVYVVEPDSSLMVDAMIDGANVDPASVTITNAATSTPTVNLTAGRADTGGWVHFLFALDTANGKQPNFAVTSDRSFGWNFYATWRPVYSYDLVNWFYASAFTESGGFYNFQFDESFVQGRVYVASHPLFLQSSFDGLAADLLTRAEVSPVAAATTQGVLGTTQANTNNIGYAIGEHPIYGLVLDWGGSTNDGGPKREMVLTCGSHPGEAVDGFLLRGFLNWVMDDDSPEAVAFRRNWRIHLYMMVAPNGRAAGHRRSNLYDTVDPNRDWADFTLYETALIANDITAELALDTGGRLDVMMGWHGAGSRTTQTGFYAPATIPADVQTRFDQALASVSQSTPENYGLTADTSAPDWAMNQGAHIALDPEGQMRGSTLVTEYEQAGADFAQAIQLLDSQNEFSTAPDLHFLSDTASATDTWSVSCNIRTTFTAGISAADLGTQGALASASVEAAAISNSMVSAIAQASAAIVDGASAGEAWVSLAQASGALQAGVAAGDGWFSTEIVEGIEQFAETSQAAAQFLAAVHAVQSLTATATLSDTIRATVRVILGLSEGATAADHWQATERQMVKHLSAVVDLQAVFQVAARVGATLEGSASASAFFTTGARVIQYLVLSAIRVTAALTANVHIKPGY